MKLHDFATRYGYTEHPLMALSSNLPPGCWIAGGAVRDFIAGNPSISDVDYFYDCPASLLGHRAVEATEHRNHWTWIDGKGLKHQYIKVAYYDNMLAVIDSFDFTPCMAITDGVELVTGPYTLYDIARKRLQVNRINYATSSVRRMFKYMAKGYTACDGCIATMLSAISDDPATRNGGVLYVD